MDTGTRRSSEVRTDKDVVTKAKDKCVTKYAENIEMLGFMDGGVDDVPQPGTPSTLRPDFANAAETPEAQTFYYPLS